MQVDETTMSRRLSALQKQSGAQLYARNPDGVWQLTPTGNDVILHVESIEQQVTHVTELTNT